MEKERLTVSNAQEAKKLDRQLAKRGYVPLPRPAHFGNGSKDGAGDKTDMQKFVESKLYADPENPNQRPSIPRVFASGGGEVSVSEKIGTKGLGYIKWGVDNYLPNTVAILTEMLPYMAASHKFNVDLVTGIGVEPMYHYTQYVGGNITEKDIPYEDAGTLLKGWKLDVLRQISQLDAQQPQQNQQPAAVINGQAVENGDPYRKALEERLGEIEADLAVWEQTAKEVAEFFERNNSLQTYLHLAADQILLGMSFPEIDVQQSYIDPDTKREVKTSKWKPKATAIRFRSAMTCRLEKMDKENRINYVYLSNQWLNSPLQGDVATSPDDQRIDAVRALDPSCPSSSLKEYIRKARIANVGKAQRPTRFILPTRIASPGRSYYAVPPHYSDFAGRIYDYAFTMIDDRATAKKNSRVIGYVIYVHNDYMLMWYNQNKADTDQLKEQARNKLFDEINKFLDNRDNHGKPLVSIMFRDADGKTAKAWEIVEVESNRKNTVEANERELQEISSIIFFSWGVDARLIGNSPGDVSSSGGTDLRERYLLKQIQMSSTQQLLLKPYYVVRDVNEWDLRHLRFRIKREVLTTLDNSKTGIATAEDN